MVLSELIREFDLVFGGAMQGLKDLPEEMTFELRARWLLEIM